MANLKYPTIVKVAIADDEVTATTYTTRADAEAAYAGFVNGGDYSEVYLNLDALPSKSYIKPSWTGTWTDAAGDVRVVGTGVLD